MSITKKHTGWYIARDNKVPDRDFGIGSLSKSKIPPRPLAKDEDGSQTVFRLKPGYGIQECLVVLTRLQGVWVGDRVPSAESAVDGCLGMMSSVVEPSDTEQLVVNPSGWPRPGQYPSECGAGGKNRSGGTTTTPGMHLCPMWRVGKHSGLGGETFRILPW